MVGETQMTLINAFYGSAPLIYQATYCWLNYWRLAEIETFPAFHKKTGIFIRTVMSNTCVYPTRAPL